MITFGGKSDVVVWRENCPLLVLSGQSDPLAFVRLGTTADKAEKLWMLRVPEAGGHSSEHPENAINVTAVIEPGVQQRPDCQPAGNSSHYAHSVIVAPKS